MGNENNKRIAKNTALLYLRMIVMMAISLYTSRVILKALGVVDMGIYNVVGSIVTFLAFINNSMSIAVQRFLTFEMGQNNLSRLNKTFNMSIYIHILIALIIIAGAGTLGYFILDTLNIPLERIEAAKYVYNISIITCCIGVIRVPFNAAIIAYERMDIYAYLSILEVSLSLLIAFIISNYPNDRLEFYATLHLLCLIITFICYTTYSYKQFKDIKLKLIWDGNIFKRLLSFASWSALGELSWAFTLQGVNFVLNSFFGPIVNTARGIATQVQSAVMRFVSGFQTAVNPQITKRYAAQETDSMYTLVIRSTNFSYYLILILSLPIILRMDYILTLWLDKYPSYTTTFCRLILINCLLDSLSNLLASVVKAHGKIRNYQILVSFMLMLNLPLSYIILKAGLPAYSTYFIYAAISIALLIIRLLFLNKMMKFPVKEFLKKAILKLFLITSIILPIPIITNTLLHEGNFCNFIIVALVSTICTTSIIYFMGLENSEKTYVKNLIKTKIGKR